MPKGIKNTFMSNMHPCQIIYNNKTYYSAEAAYQGQKCQFQKATAKKRYTENDFTVLDGKAAKAKSHKLDIDHDKWQRVNLKIMKEILDVKFSNQELLEQLKKVPGEIVEYNTWHDNYYGFCTCEKCTSKHKNVMTRENNHLGQLLMKLRK